MATLREVWDFLSSTVTSATSGITGTQITVGPGWPSQNLLQSLSQSGNVVVNIYDRSGSKNVTKWLPFISLETITSASVTISLSASSITPSGSQTITLGNTVAANDAVAILIKNNTNNVAVVSVSLSGSDLTTMATSLTSNLNLASSGLISASQSGASITITNLTGQDFILIARTANVANAQVAYRQVLRHLQIVVWAPSEALRELVSDPIDSTLSLLQANFGGQLADGSWAWVVYSGDIAREDYALKNLYRRDFFVDVQYDVTAAQVLYPVLLVQNTIESQAESEFLLNFEEIKVFTY